MTINKMKKSDLDALYKKLNINQIDTGALFSIKKILETEVNSSMRVDFNEPHLIARNITCFDNCLSCLNKGDVVSAWWEMTDITSYKQDDEYVTTNELALIKIALSNIINAIDKNADS